MENIKRSDLSPKQIRQKKLHHTVRRIKDWGISTGFLLPSLAGVMLFFFVPFAMLIVMSFQKSATNSSFVGFENYKNVLTNDAFLEASENTAVLSAIAVPLGVLLSLMLALILNSKIPARSTFRSILLTPMMVPVASVVLMWQVFFSYNGILNGWLVQLFSLDRIDWMKDELGQIVIIFLFLWKNLGLNIILFLSALNNIPQEIIESSVMDGAGAVRRFFSIRLYYLGPTVFFVTIMSLINSFKIFREEYLLTGDYPYGKLYTLQHFMNNKFQHLDYSQLSTGAVIMCIVMIIIVGILFITESRLDSGTEE
ncbi:multiple sugar transport system permease protein [Ruminococcaceae bacterium YRB3002]|nr:multiple sugar transport system permease protein [Ruminococcaceae bacterium YRB3002]